MTPREQTLLKAFLATLALALGVGVANAVLDHWAALDEELVRVKRQGVRLIESRQEGPTVEPDLSSLLVPEDQPASASLLASVLGPEFREAGLSIVEFRIIEDGDDGWILYSLQGSAPAWLRFLAATPTLSPRPLFREVSIRRQEGSRYQFTFEVGYARRR